MNLDSKFLRRTGRTQRMIEAAIKAAIGQDASGRPKDVMIITGSRDNSRIFRQLREKLPEKNFTVNKAEGIVSFYNRGRIQVLTTEHHAVDKSRLEVFGFEGPVYFDHFAIEWLYGHAIEKWLEFTNEPGKS